MSLEARARGSCSRKQQAKSVSSFGLTSSSGQSWWAAPHSSWTLSEYVAHHICSVTTTAMPPLTTEVTKLLTSSHSWELRLMTSKLENKLLTSFCGFAPAEDGVACSSLCNSQMEKDVWPKYGPYLQFGDKWQRQLSVSVAATHRPNLINASVERECFRMIWNSRQHSEPFTLHEMMIFFYKLSKNVSINTSTDVFDHGHISQLKGNSGIFKPRPYFWHEIRSSTHREQFGESRRPSEDI